MHVKPFVSLNFCSKCKCPVPRLGVSFRTNAGNITTTTPFVCPNCKSKSKKRGKYGQK